MKTLQECLVDYDTTLMRAIAERRGVELSTSHRLDMAAELAAALLEPDSLLEALAWLIDEERQALDALMASGGRMRIHRFEQRAGVIRRFGPGSLAREAPWREPVSPAEGLWYRGLIGRGFSEEARTVVEFIFIPTDLRPLLPPPQVDQAPFAIPKAAEPHTVGEGDLDAVDDVCMLLSAAQGDALEQSNGRLVSHTVTRVSAQLLDPDEARLEFVYHIAQSAGLLRVRGRAVHIARDRVRDWLKHPRAHQLRVLQEAWRGDETWNDLWHVPGIRCEETGWRSDPVAARAAILELLSRCNRDAWLSIAGFVDVVRERASDYLRPDGDFESWYIRDARSGEYLTGFEHWDRVEGAMLIYVLSGPLHWLGLVSLGYREGWEKPTAFQLSPWGAAFLGLVPFPSDERWPPPSRVAPDATVTMPRTVSLSDRFQLARVAEWRESGSEYVYVVTPSSLGRALSAGIQVERIERFLRRISQESVPAAAMARIRSWAARYGHVRMRRAAILETRSPQVMSELRAHGRVRGYLRQALSPTTVLVRESDWDALIQELHRAGYLPEIIDS